MKVLEAAHRLPVLLAASLAATPSNAAENKKQVEVMPGEIKWTAVPVAPGVKLFWLTGGQDKPGLYELRVHPDKGAVVPPLCGGQRAALCIGEGQRGRFSGFWNRSDWYSWIKK